MAGLGRRLSIIARKRRTLARRLRTSLYRGPYRRLWRAIAQRRVRGGLRPGVTVVTVNFNSREFLTVLVDAVRRFSPPDVELLVVDNGSSDGTDAYLKEHPGIGSVRFPVNLGHGPAMDLGFLRVRTEFAIALDVDAFPINERWIDAVVTPLRQGSRVAGARASVTSMKRDYVHPSYLAMRVADFVDAGHTFSPGPGLQAGSLISMREEPNLAYIDATSVRGPGPVGSVFGGVVYHNYYSTRFKKRQDDDVIDLVVSRDDASSAWREATRRYLDITDADVGHPQPGPGAKRP